MASLVLYMYKMWLLAGWRVHGQVSSITYNIYFLFQEFPEKLNQAVVT